MLIKHFTLYTIEQIFKNDCKVRLSATEKMLYINCLTHNFKDKQPNLQNLNDFIIIKASIPNFIKHKEQFDNLCNAGLVKDELHSLKFISHWIKYIELNKISQAQEFGTTSKVDLNKFENDFYNSQQLIELCGMKYSLNRSQVQKLMKEFLQEQVVSDKTYSNIGDAKKHFIYWCANNKDKAPQEAVVKSKSKILGL